jgi:hypothetical protein
MKIKQKHYLVSWSGGVDSTYLIHKLLQDGHLVSAFYTALFNNVDKTKRETDAITEIRKIFELNPNFLFKGSNNIELWSYGSCIALKQVPSWICSLLYFAENYYDAVAIAYIMGDDAISYIPDIEKIWNAYRGISVDTLPKLEFPLTKMKKAEAWNYLPLDIRQHVTWCEDDGTPTCQCHSCARMVFEVPRIIPNLSDLQKREPEKAKHIQDTLTAAYT